MRALGRSLDEAAVFSLPSPLLPWVAIFLALAVASLAPALLREGPAAALLYAALWLGLFVMFLFPRKLVVGADGILLVWIGKRFIPYKDIAYVETSDGFVFKNPGINIVLRSGSAVDFSTSIFKERWAERDSLLTLLRVVAAESEEKIAPRTPDALLRAGREPLVWAQHLRGIGAGAGTDLRTPSVPVEDLLRVAESPFAAPVDRTAAFVVLAASDNPDIKSRLRFAVEQTAEPEARAALEGALARCDDEHAVAEVLGSVALRAEKR